MSIEANALDRSNSVGGTCALTLTKNNLVARLVPPSANMSLLRSEAARAFGCSIDMSLLRSEAPHPCRLCVIICDL